MRIIIFLVRTDKIPCILKTLQMIGNNLLRLFCVNESYSEADTQEEIHMQFDLYVYESYIFINCNIFDGLLSRSYFMPSCRPTHITGRTDVGCPAHMEENCGLNFVKLSGWVSGCHVMKFCK